MDLSNRSFAALGTLTALLVGGAVAITVLPPRGPDEPLEDPTDLVVQPTVERRGGTDIAHGGSLEILPEPGTTPTSARLVCDTYKSERPFIKGMAEYPSLPLGDCSVTLDGGARPYGPVFPGDRLVCAVVDGHTRCTGGFASQTGAVVRVDSALPGTLAIDGETVGRLPQADLRLKIGVRNLEVRLDDGRTLRWPLIANPEQEIDVRFPDPATAGGAAGRQRAASR